MRPRTLLALLATAVLVSGCGAQPGTVSVLASSKPQAVQPIEGPHSVRHVHSATTARTRPRPHHTPVRTRAVQQATVRHAFVAPTSPTPAGPLPTCGRTSVAPATYKHVIWIWLENRSFDTVIGPRGTWAHHQAPYLNQLADSCGLATNYHNISHPSQPNYFAAVAGTTGDVTTNCEPSTCSLPHIPTLFTQLTSAGLQWRSYEQNMPSACVSQNVGNYVDRHNPEVYFPSDRAQCLAWDLPLGTLSGGPMVDALNANALPAFSFVTPDVCEDMHSCRTRTGDDWLSEWVPRIVASPGYEDGSTAIFITFDEGEGGRSYDCADNTTDIGCHVATIVVSPSTPRGDRSGELFNHYGLLKTTEQMLGIRQYLGHAGDADTRSMVTAFRL